MKEAIFLVPPDPHEPVRYWLIEQGAVLETGSVETGQKHRFDGISRTMMLVSQTDSVVRWHDLPDIPRKQAEAAVGYQMKEYLVTPADAHIVASRQADGRILSAHITASKLQACLDRLASHGIDPDIIMPVGLLLPDDGSGAISVSLAGQKLLRSGDLIAPDEPAMRELLLDNCPVRVVDDWDVETAFASALANPPVNLRQAAFARRKWRLLLSAARIRVLIYIFLAIGLASLLLGLATLWRYHSAAAREDGIALALVQKFDPKITDVEQAQGKMDRLLVEKGGGGSAFLPLSAALYSSMQKISSVHLQSLHYGEDGILYATIAAPASDAINPVLIDLQKQGYRLTATPRQDASGMTLADISVRFP